MSALRLVLAEDHAALRADLRRLLEASEQVLVVGEAGDGKELLRVLDRVACDAVLLDLAMPKMSGLEVLAALSKRPSHPPVIILSNHDDASHVDRALSLGASGYVLKSAPPAEIAGAIRAAIAGGAYLQPTVAQGILKRHMLITGPPTAAVTRLSSRQHDLLRAMALGLANKEIAHRLGIGEETVKGYLKKLYPRIGVSSRASAVAWGIRHGLID